LPFPLTISSNQNKSIVKKQLYAGKVPEKDISNKKINIIERPMKLK